MQNKISIWWSKIKAIFDSEGVDFTSIPLNKAIIMLSAPMVLEMIMESAFAVVDIFFVAKLGNDAIAAVGITESLMTIIYSVAIGLSIGTMALVSRRIGEKRVDQASHYGFQALVVSITLGILIGILGYIYGKDLLLLMGASKELVAKNSGYTTIMLSTNIVVILLFVNNAIFKGAGDALISMKVLWLANGINMVLDPILIFGFGPIPAMGIEGAAIATTIGRGAAVIWQMWILFNGSARIHFIIIKLHINIKDMWHLLEVSLGGMFQMVIPHIAWVAMVRLVSLYGSDAVAGYTLAIRVLIFSLLPSLGIANAASTLVGQNLGANRADRAEKTIYVTSLINMVSLGVVALLFLLFPTLFIKVFTTDRATIYFGGECLRIIGYGLVAYGIGMVVIQAFNGAGDTRTPTYINLFIFWILEIPLAYLLAVEFGFKQNGIFYAILFSETVMTLIVIYLFRQGKWKSFKA